MYLDLSKKLDLEEIRALPNVAVKLSEDDLLKIGGLVLKGYHEDKISRKDWEDQVQQALDLAELKREPKTYPFVNAANIKYPLLTTANIQFAARTYPEIVRNGKVVEVTVMGRDQTGEKAERARRVSSHMSYQLLVESDEWEENTDRLLHLLPTVGTCFKKTWFDPIKGVNRSILCLHDEIIVNDNISCLAEAKRITHILSKTKNQLVEMIRAGYYTKDMDILARCESDEVDADIVLLEQHRWLDLDQDGYEEPYIVTVDKETNRVLRIVARFDGDGIKKLDDDTIVSIKAVSYFTDFHFIPSPSGKYHSIGFGHLLTPLNSAVNTILNQLVDSGKLANMQGGFVSSRVRSKEKDIKLQMGEFKQLTVNGDVDLSKNIIPLTYKEPSQVLFSLLGMLIQATEKLSSVTDALTGSQPGQNVPATTMLALVEQGLKVFTSIQRRLYRGFKKEYELLYRLNRVYLDEVVYMRTMDDEQAILQSDYEEESFDVRPVSDPGQSSDAQRLAKTEIYLNMIQMGLIDPKEGTERYLKALDIPNIEALMPQPAGPSIDEQELQAKIAKEQESLRLQAKDLEIRAMDAEVRSIKAEAEVTKTLALATEAIAKAESLNVQSDVAKFNAEVSAMKVAFQNIENEFGRSVKNRETNVAEKSQGIEPTEISEQEPPQENEVANVTDNEGPTTGLEGQSSDESALPPTE